MLAVLIRPQVVAVPHMVGPAIVVPVYIALGAVMTVMPPSDIALEMAAAQNQLHYAVPKNQGHYAVGANALDAAVPKNQGHYAAPQNQLHFTAPPDED